ncbi:MAG: hypothetical protein K5681_03625 [Treponema sp.]|nr:hypothetical protein [Treponema sp.]
MAKEIENLPPENFVSSIKIRIFLLNQILKLKNAAIKHAPPGKIRVIRNKGHLQFYKRNTTADLQGKYLPCSQRKIALTLLQKEYDLKALAAAKKELELLQDFLHKYEEANVSLVYDKLSPLKQGCCNPVTLPDTSYEKKWLAQEYSGKELSTESAGLYTENDELVRSKSEVIIANTLKTYGIPYKYEYPIPIEIKTWNMNNNRSCYFHPDFYCLNLKTRQEYAWEHFGMMDDADYATKAAEKLMIYQENGFFPGKNLIITMESNVRPLSTKDIKKVIEAYLK